MKKQSRSRSIITFVILCFISGHLQAQLVVTSSTNYAQLVDSLILSGVSVSNVAYTGHIQACGYFSNGSSTNLGTNSGVILSTGLVVDIDNGVAYNGSYNLGTNGNPLMTALTGGNTGDAAVLEFDIVPDYDTLSFSFIYGSEDYPEWVGGNPLFQDHIGAFITGANPAGGTYTDQNFVFVPNTNLPVIVNNINSSTNSQYFVNNTTGSVMFDGFTTLLETKIAVVPATSYHLTFAIADGGDQISDAGVFLKSHSLRSYGTNTGISDAGTQKLFNFYPNPATENIIVNTTAKGTLFMTNQLGQLINVFAISAKQTQIAFGHLQSGIYSLTFYSEKSVATRMLVVHP